MSAAEHGTVVGGDGVKLAVRTAGPLDAPPIVLLHGWAQSGAVWQRQLDGPLARRFRLIAPDLRGHGDSDKPEDGYADPRLWAADVRAVLELAGRPAVLVGWSYGGLVLTDHLRVHGTAGLAGIMLVGAITEIGRGRPGGAIGPLMRAALPAALSTDEAEATAALRAFVTGMIDGRPSRLAEALLAQTLRVPARVRAALFARDVDSADVLRAADLPALVLHGSADRVVTAAAAEYAAELLPRASSITFDGVGHVPFAERPTEFDAALAEFTQRCAATEEASR
jgi:non-heme chloroperoxidase